MNLRSSHAYLCLLLGASLFCAALPLRAQVPTPGEIAWALSYDPKTLDPAKVDDQASELVRYLTAGVLVRVNRSTMSLQPELAESWKVSADGKLITLRLRRGLQFSDGSPLAATDVVSSLLRVLDPATAAPAAEEFLQPAKVTVRALDASTVQIAFPERVVQALEILDEIAIQPAGRSTQAQITSGPFHIVESKPGQYLRLARNPFYWKTDAAGKRLPYLEGVRLDVLGNRDTEELRFLRGQYALLNEVPPATFATVSKRLPGAVHDLGPSLNTEQMWFNQSAAAPIPDFEKQWFTNRAFRAAVSAALHRTDMARIAFDGHATPANGFISPANKVWYNRSLAPVREDTAGALQMLASQGFQKRGAQLFDREGHPVKFSLLTNAGNRSRERMASLIQQDLAAVGMQVNVVSLDFPALIERLMHSNDYEAALLGLSNVQPDPGSMMNIWLSSSPNHQWNPAEKTPATAWEREIDQQMQLQATAADPRSRKAAMDKVQTIVAEQMPFIYLVYPDALCAASPRLKGVQLSVLPPAVVSEIERVRQEP